MTEQTNQDENAWSLEFSPPTPLKTEHLRRTLQWGDWPRADFALAENREDFDRHLFRSFLAWIDEEFPLETVAIDAHDDDSRGGA